MVEKSNTLYEMKFTGSMALPTRIPETYFLPGGTAGKFRENGQKQENYCYAN